MSLSIRLRLLCSGGQPEDLAWPPFRPGECVLLPAARPGAAAPEIRWQSGGWIIDNPAGEHLLFVNGEVLTPCDQRPLAVGDEIECGLCRFAVETAEDPAEEAAQAVLADRLAHAIEIQHDANNPFGMVPASSNDDKSPPVGERQNLAQDDPVRMLNREYFRVLHDPQAQINVLSAALTTYETQQPQVPQDNKNLTLEELVSGELHIDDILARLPPPAASRSPRQENGKDILWLFAPPEEKPLVRHTPPETTRHDHHATALDSSQALGATRPPETPQ